MTAVGTRHPLRVLLPSLALSGAASLMACGGPSAPPVEEGLRPVNGTELYVMRLGRGDPIIVVHGGPMLEHGYLLPHLAPLAQSHELVFYDQRLSGRSAPRVDSASVTINTFVEDIEALRQSLGLGRIHLMGHSWGGLLAMRYAIAHEDRLRSLILLDPMSASSKLWQAEERALAQRLTAADSIERQAILGSPGFVNREPMAIERMLRWSFRHQFHDPVALDSLRLYVPVDYQERSRQFFFLGPELGGFDFHDDLARLTVPTLIVFGSDEPGAALGGAALRERMPHAEFVLIDEAGHFPFVEQPGPFLAAVEGFLQRR